jgi:LCP family protein required for cell wall assembly
MKKFFKSFFISLLIFCVAYAGLGRYLKKSNNAEVVGEEVDEEFEEKNKILFLLLGVDAKDINQKGTRTDTMMLINIDFQTGETKLLSIPRDTRVNIRGLNGQRKINAAHANGGPELSVKAVKDLLGVDLEYYVKVDYRAVEEIVDAIGGVTVDIPKDMYYSDPTADPPLLIDLKKGEQQLLDGDKSIQFLRYRKGYKDADLGRIKAQQQFMKAFMEQALKPKNILGLPKMVSAYYKYVDTNIPLGTLSKMALIANKINTETMETATIPGYGKKINGTDYLIYKEDEMNSIVKEMFGNYVYSNRTTEN